MKREDGRRWEVYRSGVRKLLGMTNQWRFRRRAPNGKILCNSGESYHNWQDAFDAITEIERGGAKRGELKPDGGFIELDRKHAEIIKRIKPHNGH